MSALVCGLLDDCRYAWLISAPFALPQMNTAEITGVVKDPSGATVSNATIDAVEVGTRLKYTTVSNASGEFLLALGYPQENTS